MQDPVRKPAPRPRAFANQSAFPRRPGNRTAQKEKEQSQHWRVDRASARALRDAFPQVASVRFELTFSEPLADPPAGQSHVLHPPARAFFKFRCPYSNCNGTFDLTAATARLFDEAAAVIAGDLVCPGTRCKAVGSKEGCGVIVHYLVRATYQT